MHYTYINNFSLNGCIWLDPFVLGVDIAFANQNIVQDLLSNRGYRNLVAKEQAFVVCQFQLACDGP